MSPLRRNTLGNHSARVWCVSPFPDNERVVSASHDGAVIVWNLRTMEEERRWDHERATAVAVSPDGKMVVSGGDDGALQLWDADSGDHLSGPWQQHENERRVWSVSWSPDGGRVASCSADDTLVIWNASSGEALLGPLQTEHKYVRAIAYCPKGRKVATGGHDSTIKIWNDDTGVLQVTLRGHTERVSSVAWTKCGSRIISGSVDRTVRVWDCLKEQTVHVIQHTGAINCIAVSDHVFATASADHTIHLWDLETYQRLDLDGSFELSKRDEAHCVALTADENTLVACTEKYQVYTFDIKEIVGGRLGRVGKAWDAIRHSRVVVAVYGMIVRVVKPLSFGFVQ
ncbi:hypothetical protein AZE42_04828 [Rhizopogon vesiculosus]|uniref:Uncharacterized protein n=1 Tax=Rhizopogon vesiculosus TaxID=180088 RepID=A0A1J8PHA8_9AGAM|nr:hypothetical protein AZE42_04828 [Rhizopogon vesiculosus]